MFVKVKVIPDSHKQKLEVLGTSSFLLHVKEPAENNLANMRVLAMLREHYTVGAGAIRIISGHHKPNKIVEVKLL